MSEKPDDTTKDKDEEELKPLQVEITNQPKEKEKENPTSYDTVDQWDITPTEEEIKEMQDAQ